jgi:hypothetical protein
MLTIQKLIAMNANGNYGAGYRQFIPPQIN